MSRIMPRRRVIRRRRPIRRRPIRRRTFRRRRGIARMPRAVNPRGMKRSMVPGPFPNAVNMKFKYSEIIDMVTLSTAIPQTYQYSGNGMFDPNITGTGTQPQYFDTLIGGNDSTAPYRRYRVNGSKIVLRIYDGGGTTTGDYPHNCVFTIQPRQLVATGALDFAKDMLNQPMARITYLAPSNAGGRSPRICSHYAKTKAVYQVKDTSDNESFSGFINANPANQWFWLLALCQVDPNSYGATFNIVVNITYYATVYDLNIAAAS